MRILKTTVFLSGVTFILILIGCNRNVSVIRPDYPVIYTMQDSAIVMLKLNEMKNLSNDSLSEIFVEVAKSFIGSPYVGHTLEVGENESLVVNLREFDCTTFVESCFALSLTIKSGQISFYNFCNNLKNIRYRDGLIDGYLSRLHYFSDWISNNQNKGYVHDYTRQAGGLPYPNRVYFMSSHVDAYKQLKADSLLLKPLTEIENEISSHEFFYISEENIEKALPKLCEGMIVAFTTGIIGLDIIHTGILVKVDREIHLLHASSDEGKVIICNVPLVEYITRNRLQTGIMVLGLN